MRFLKISALLFSCLLFIGVAAGLGVFWTYLERADEPIEKLENSYLDPADSKPSRILDRTGKVLWEYRADRREFVPFDKIPKLVRDAMIAAEDRRFYSHNGVDYISLLRQVVTNSRSGKIQGGASTIPMQLAKSVTGDQRTMDRKLTNMAVAIKFEQKYPKDKILEMYLNTSYFGMHAFGVKAAAKVYFNKDLDQLTLSEAATLARCVRRPSDQNPIANKRIAVKNRDVVLASMLEEGMISKAQYDKAKSETLKVVTGESRRARMIAAPYFVDHVKAILVALDKGNEPKKFDLMAGGIEVTTTLDLDFQRQAEQELRKSIQRNRGYRVTTGAVVVMNRFGEILAEVGGPDYNREQFNAAYLGSRQPGSSFKSFVYATGIAKGEITADSSLSNEPVTYPGGAGREDYEPHNAAGERVGGMMDVRRAFALSYNLPAIDLINRIGPSEVVRYCQDVFGFQSSLFPGLALALGSSDVSPLEMAQGYSVFMLRGDRATPFAIKQIKDSTNNTIINEFEPRIIKGVLDPMVCDQMDDLLRGVIQFGTGGAAKGVTNGRGKTGTTNDHRDAWFCGYAQGLCGIVWIANDKYKPMTGGAWGGTVSAPLWASVMLKALDRYGDRFKLAYESSPSSQPKTPTAEETKPTVAPQDEPPADPNEDMDSGGQDEAPAVPVVKSPADENAEDKPAKPKKKTENTPLVTQEDQSTNDAEDRPKAPKKPKREQAEYVEVEVCSESGRKATMYCPSTISRRFKKGSEPRLSCTTHR